MERAHPTPSLGRAELCVAGREHAQLAALVARRLTDDNRRCVCERCWAEFVAPRLALIGARP